jgi:hypothetical protein
MGIAKVAFQDENRFEYYDNAIENSCLQLRKVCNISHVEK